jgi:hypothetical protein
MRTERFGFRAVWTCKTCKNRGDFWWALLHRHTPEWRKNHPGAAEDWRSA